MKSRQAKTDYIARQQRYRVWLSYFAVILALGVLLYYGYCWGWWGRSSLMLQYLFQCSCPIASEEARYPEQVDVVVRACRQSYVELSPNGRFLQVNEGKSGVTSTYLLDLQTMEKIPAQSFSSFLTDDLGFLESGLEYYIVDRTTGKQYHIRKFAYWQSGAYINGQANLNLLVEALREAKYVFFRDYDGTLVALASDFQNQLDRNFFLPRSNFPGREDNRVEQFLQENNITYQTILVGFPGEALSPNGRFVARSDGIYLVETDQKIVDGYSLDFIRNSVMIDEC